MSASGVQNEGFKLGLLLTVKGEGGALDAVEMAREAESQGWDGVCFRGGPGAGEAGLLAAAAAATVTERLRLGVEILPGPTLHPLRLAEDLSMVDIASAGRLEWMPGESPILSKSERDEAIEIVLEAWAGKAFSHSGTRWSFPKLTCVPTPEQRPSPPVWCSLGSALLMRGSGRTGCWLSLDQVPEPGEKSEALAVCGRWVETDSGGAELRFGPSRVPYADWARSSLPAPRWLYIEQAAGRPMGPGGPIRQRARTSIVG
ncbi:MAG: LLM class flavin-dependent oxidoreductase [Myxococcota bacterium]|nr:LLM class flavin-dependent oxidoreductase [Myxococcota bacterium]